ncbi:class I SAM-dependent methyltransferase [Motiliproteus sediminis]|uniref:class I SAM-dependent methyltransferase n=1 Tax=Motiliproteus sediminis TaxID=1468178 RepID=UPI001AEF55AA|nr:class I SAM-dependent methyltransferase [Motiliproteus sediminis]
MDPLINALQALDKASEGDACRLFHGRGHCFPEHLHVNVDLLPPLVLITLYHEEVERLAGWIAAAAAIEGVRGVLVQRRYLRGAPTEAAWGELPDTLVVTERGLRYQVRLGRNQNSGFFLDMAAGRQWVRENARGRRVLNLFAYTCSFSLAALAGGADEVINLDMSRGALAQGRENHRLNDMDGPQVRYLGHELFRSFGKLTKAGPYELIIVDPPSYQPGSFAVEKDYPRLMGRLERLLVPGGEVLLCLNDPGRNCAFLQQHMAERAPALQFVERIANPDAFPEADPERSLKVLRYRLPD